MNDRKKIGVPAKKYARFTKAEVDFLSRLNEYLVRKEDDPSRQLVKVIAGIITDEGNLEPIDLRIQKGDGQYCKCSPSGVQLRQGELFVVLNEFQDTVKVGFPGGVLNPDEVTFSQDGFDYLKIEPAKVGAAHVLAPPSYPLNVEFYLKISCCDPDDTGGAPTGVIKHP